MYTKLTAVIHREQTELTWNNYVHNEIEKMQEDFTALRALWSKNTKHG